MTFDEYFSSRVGKGIDYDGNYGVQCFDLANDFSVKVVGGKQFIGMGAYEIYTNFYNQPGHDLYERIANTPDFVPKKGDIIVWSQSLSKWGHVAICNGKGDTTWFESYDQNWTGRNDPVTLIKHNYNYVLGVLRAKDQTKINGKPVTKPTQRKTLDSDGLKYDDKNGLAVLALKQLLYIAKAKGWITANFKNDKGFGDGTQKAVNEMLKRWNYKQNGIAGENFIKRIGEELK